MQLVLDLALLMLGDGTDYGLVVTELGSGVLLLNLL